MRINSVHKNAATNLSSYSCSDRTYHPDTEMPDDKYRGASILKEKNNTLPRQHLDFTEQLAVYKADQLLSNPGAKKIYFSSEDTAHVSTRNMEWEVRIGKDLEDALLNIKNFFLNGINGADKYYRAENGKIKQTKSSPGFLHSLINFMKDIGSALSMGIWRPDGENAQNGVADSLLFCASKLKEAMGGDLLGGMAGSVIQMGEDLALAGWNLMEAVPDMLFGHFETGGTIIDTIFDNGQVAVDYITDVLPGGEAWMRVHAADITDGKFPILYNLKMPANVPHDVRWKTIHNTPFRKSIETIGSLLADAAMIYMISQGITSSDNRR